MHLMPVSLSEFARIANGQAAKALDRARRFDENDMKSFLACVLGGAQFKVGTDLWATKSIGLLPAPNFGRFMSHDKFDRIRRYLSRGPVEAGDTASDDPWYQVRYLFSGFNENRRRTINPSWLQVVDETMFAWTGNGMPHLSFVKRKPEPLGAEIKNLCDGESGVMLFMELQEGKDNMEDFDFVGTYSKTTACTLRLAKGAGLDEHQHRREEDRPFRVLVGDSWFASFQTARALYNELGLRFIGNVKTAHSRYPIDEMRSTLADTDRGDHVVMKYVPSEDEEDEQSSNSIPIFAVGWNDHHYKTFITNTGTSDAGAPAKKKRQDTSGANYWIDVKRVSVLGTYYKAAGVIDQHNRYRQYLLKLEKIWRTTNWQKRIFMSMIGTTVVDAYLAWKYHRGLPASDEQEDSSGGFSSRFLSFTASVIKQLDPQPTGAINQGATLGCRRVRIGSSTGTNNKKKPVQKRCTMCSNKKRHGTDNRAPRTIWMCCVHNEVYLCADNQPNGSTCWAEHVASAQI